MYRPRTVGAKPKYPWRQWSDGNWHRVVRGVHFECEPEHFRVGVYQRARRDGWCARAFVDGDAGAGNNSLSKEVQGARGFETAE